MKRDISSQIFPGKSLHHEDGTALLIVMWACTLLAIMLGGYAMQARTKALTTHYQYTQARAYYAAQAGVMYALQRIQSSQPRERWITDGRVYAWRFEGIAVTVSVRDESGKIDLNHATGDVLLKLLQLRQVAPPQAVQLMQQIENWRAFTSSEQRHQIQAVYQASGRDYAPRYGPFASLEELQLVLGMTPTLYDALAPDLTIWSYREMPNPATASLVALQTIPGYSLAQAQMTIMARANRHVSAGAVHSGSVASIRAVAATPDGIKAALSVSVRLGYTQAGGQPYSVLHWQEEDGVQ